MKKIVEMPPERRKVVVIDEQTKKELSFWAPKTMAQIQKRNEDIKLWGMRPGSPLVQ